MNFTSDTAAPAHPKILEALSAVNAGDAASYGADAASEAARRRLSEVFETDVEVWFVASGTAANALALSVLCSPVGAVLCHEGAHIEHDERGAPEFFTGGGKLRLLPGAHGKIDGAALAASLDAIDQSFFHEAPAEVLSLSNLTEAGTAYSPEEVWKHADAARAKGLWVHSDGARFANAVAAGGASPADLSWRAGVDVMTFGATKNGALGCEAIILFGAAREKFADLVARAKRGGHAPPKMRYLAAQMSAYLENDLWLSLARDANASAKLLADVLLKIDGVELAHPVDGNEVFVHLPAAAVEKLKAAGAGFYPWPDGSFRFVCAWNTTVRDIEAIASIIG